MDAAHSAKVARANLSRALRDLLELARDGDPTVGDLIDRLRHRGVAAVLALLTLPIALPIPLPGISAAFGLPLLLIALQLTMARPRLWLPGVVRRRRIDRQKLTTLVEKTDPWLQRIDDFLRPRLEVLCHPICQRLYGVICALLALVLFLPVPFGNVLPGLAVVFLALSILTSDGLAALIGLVLAVASVVVTSGAIIALAAGFIALF